MSEQRPDQQADEFAAAFRGFLDWVLANGPGSTLGCLRLALLLVTNQHGRYIVMVQAPNEHQANLQIEVAGLPVDLAQRLLAELDQLRAELNVYRGHLLDVSLDPMDRVVLTFADPPDVGRDDVVLSAAVLGGPNSCSRTALK